ncbi:hypothetical protein J2Z40_002296 [Cytobacillus eiseniae]|uniref:Helix-turn-helix domain-containing protein n=2 Tax=Cytobacillus TaxID=2675230 RepID=A0ABS4RHC8_9BACI|nr:hypothetical protein [Cytobacillus eiseniae]MBP2241724.1 hypothetical protein [Cytobacillus eiseniae]
MMSYTDFMDYCQRMGLDPFSYLMPTNVFKKVDDNAQYETSDIAEYMELSDRQVRRILLKGKAKLIRMKPFTCTGLEVKQAVFQNYYKYIMNNFPLKK